MKLFESAARLILRFKSVRKTQLVTRPVQTVCFFSNTALGDTIFNTPVFRVFRQNFPHVRTVALLNPSTAPLFKTDPNIDEILLYDGKKGGFLRALFALKKIKPDVIFILHSNEPQSTPLAVLCGAKYVFKLPNAGNKFSPFHSNAPEPYGDERYVVLNRLEQLKFMGIDSCDTRLNLYLRDEDFTRADEMLKDYGTRKFIGFQMGASTVSRQWFLQRWQELANLILKHTDAAIVLTGSPAERAMTAQLEDELRSPRVINAAGKFSLREAAALIARLDVLVTPDTGPLHVAAALKTPTIGLFAVASPVNSNPDFDEDIHKFIKKPRTCSPCVGKNCKFQECMLQIEAREVWEMLRDMI
ncbi:glycosyltransferase family 9 protein [uncultured Campylobacter sp.]|mgnify:FL=1|uniref:glycosyltransferase family 9 protein n=1 Tax=uncultured Campylobacter sp. TaxID=218934 RepID=UPI0026236D31|nr:glycosyltransferase family 9 protein [uncultured Campylobacter sp.]